MTQRIAFTAKNKIGLLIGEKLQYIQSHYVNDYKEQRDQIRRKRSWKTTGAFSAFRGDLNPDRYTDVDALVAKATINGLTCQTESEKLIYSVSVGNASGVFVLDPENPTADEGHIIHDTSLFFYGLDYSTSRNEIAVAIEESFMDRNIALLTMEKARLKQITEGDSCDNNPTWSKVDSGVIYYDSAGIGRNKQGMPICLGPRSIHRLDLNTAELEEVVAMKNYDCYLPKLDAHDNLYFIRRPYQKPQTGTSLIEILQIPFKIVKAIYKWIEFFTIRHTGEPLTSAGNNPVKLKQDLRQMMIDGNIINAEQSLEENRRHGELFPGIAPRSWELMRRNADGELVTLKKGVISFDLTDAGEIIYSNGSFLISLKPDGTETKLDKVDCSGAIKVL